MERITPTRVKNLLRVLDYLGKDYSIAKIDGGVCIYRDLGNGLDFEIEGAQRKNGPYSVYVWKDKNHIVDQSHEIKDLQAELNRLVSVYI